MAFILAEIILYAAFIALDIAGCPSAPVKYASICVCLAAALAHFIKTRKCFILITMALTLFADTFLLLLDRYYIIGVLSFCAVQTLYAGYMMSLSGLKSVLPRLCLFGLAAAVLMITGAADPLSVASAWSYSQLLMNVICAFNARRLHPNGAMCAAGMLLFLMCDTCVGINNITSYFAAFPYGWLADAAGFLMWVFYLPSQVLITYSFCRKEKSA